ncbi:hypothetical protein JCM3770_005658 [Rhodotorula araucariae]
MDRFLALDVTLQTLSAQLYPDEHILAHADGVGLYDGKDKSPRHTDGRAVLTSHRAIYVSASRPHSNSAYLPLALVRQTEYWAGFLKSSPKITLLLADAPPSSTLPTKADSARSHAGERDKDADARVLTALAGARNWVCRVCGMHNVPSAALGLKCSLCGVTRDPLSPPSSSSASSSPAPAPPAPPPPLPALDPTETGTRIACPVCTFLNHHSMTRCEVCDSALFPPSTSTSTSSAAPSRAATPGPGTDPASAAPTPGAAFVRLSFRRGGEKGWYAALKEALALRAWDMAVPMPPVGRGKGRADGQGDAQQGSGGAGIDAILRGIDLEARDREDSLDDALKDLESLMAKAKEMIALAQSINAQLASGASSASAREGGDRDAAARAASLATTSLHSLGLLPGAAVTADLVADDRAYHAELARELAGVLDKGRVLERAGGVIALDEVWCLWNRARGVALVSPKDLRLAAPHLSTVPRSSTSGGGPGPISLRTFPSGLTILHTPRFAPGAVRARVLDLVDTRQALVASLAAASDEGQGQGESAAEREGASVLDVAHAEGVSVGLAKELLFLLELGAGSSSSGGGGGGGGALVRDEQGEGTRWYRNWISEAVWDGQVFE